MSFFNRIIHIGVDAHMHPSESRRIRLVNVFCEISIGIILLCILLYWQSIMLLSILVINMLVYVVILLLNYFKKYLIGKVLLLNCAIIIVTCLCDLVGGSTAIQALFLIPIAISATLYSSEERFWRMEGYVLPVIMFILLEYTGYSWFKDVQTTGLGHELGPYLPFIIAATLLIALLNFFVHSADKNERKVVKLLEKTRKQNVKQQRLVEEYMQNQEELYAMNNQLEAYQSNLEEKVKVRTRELRLEKARLNHAKNELQQLHDHEMAQRQRLEVVLAELQAKEQQLSEAFEELKESETELRSNSEELKSTNEDLNKTKQNLEQTLQKESEIRTQLEMTIYELKEAQTKLVQSEKMASLGQITAGVAHEINNPINFVLAGSDVLFDSLDELLYIIQRYRSLKSNMDSTQLIKELDTLDKLCEELNYTQLKEDIHQTVADIREGAMRTAEIVKGLRNFSRVDEDLLKRADIHEGLDSTLIILRNQYKNRIEVVKTYDLSMGKIDCFPGKLNQVFMNILGNAIDAIHEEGVIYITTRNLHDRIEIIIQDSGEGIPTEVAKKIFDPFFTTKEVGKGTGLGLAIAYGIIEKHHGEISLESEVGKGARFIIRIPKNLAATLKKGREMSS